MHWIFVNYRCCLEVVILFLVRCGVVYTSSTILKCACRHKFSVVKISYVGHIRRYKIIANCHKHTIV